MVRDWATYMVPAGMSLRIVPSHNSVPSLYKSRYEIHNYKKRAFLVYEYNSNKMHKSQSLFYLTTALHVSGVTITHFQEHVVGGVRHPQHTQTGSKSSTIAADNSTV
jgi:hypothetical protein